MKIYLDMDGLFVAFYAVLGWLDYLKAQDATPYRIAKPAVNLSLLARYLNKLQSMGYEIGIISWTSKSGTKEFDMEVAEAKLEWLKTHLKSVNWNEIHIIPYGTPKSDYGIGVNAILFDDEQHNRDDWRARTSNRAYDETQLMEVLKNLCKGA